MTKLEALDKLRALLYKVEESDSGHWFRPNVLYISSCRCLDLAPLEECLKVLDFTPPKLVEGTEDD